MNKRIIAILMSVVMLIMSVAVYGSENNGYGDDYQTHSGVTLYEEVNYQELQSQLQQLCRYQEESGYTVTELTITYIMPEAIEQWMAEKEEEQFFEIPLAELEKESGENTSFYFDENGLQAYTLEDEYNWKKIAINVGAGTGIILVGATITTLTGGTASCVVICMVKAGITGASLSGATTLTINTVSGMAEGMGFSEALKNAVPEAVEDASTGFLAGTLVSGVAIQTGLMKACFVEGTSVAVPGGQKNIEDVCLGDLVYAYNENEAQIKEELVTAISNREASKLVEICTDEGDQIISTVDHLWYVETAGWKRAGDLKAGEQLRTLDGTKNTVSSVASQEKTVTVYNLTVANSHTYYVGEKSPVLVHNVCKADRIAVKIKTVVKKEIKSITKLMKKNRFKWVRNLAKFIDKKIGVNLLVSVKDICLKHKITTAVMGAATTVGTVAVNEIKIPVLIEEEDDFFE